MILLFAVGAFADSLSDYEISIPVRVNAAGEFVSHSLQHTALPPSDPPTSRRRRRSFTDTVDYRVAVAGSDLHLTVEPSWHLLGPGLVAERRQGSAGPSGSTRISTDVRSRLCHFEGHIRGRPGSTVAISTCNGLVTDAPQLVYFLYRLLNVRAQYKKPNCR